MDTRQYWQSLVLHDAKVQELIAAGNQKALEFESIKRFEIVTQLDLINSTSLNFIG